MKDSVWISLVQQLRMCNSGHNIALTLLLDGLHTNSSWYMARMCHKHHGEIQLSHASYNYALYLYEEWNANWVGCVTFQLSQMLCPYLICVMFIVFKIWMYPLE
jgi:hypothetical protein